MPQKIIKHDSLPKEIIATISQLGDRIRVARKRRGITMEEMSSRMFVNRKTLARLENGDSAVSLAVFASARIFVLPCRLGSKAEKRPLKMR
jgi:transcriptional regulator with XRE-family HTH domain